jgi:hypothetical protein
MQQPPNQEYPQQQWQQPPMSLQQPYPPQQYQQPPQYQPPKKNLRKRLWLLVAAVFVIGVILGVASRGQNQQPTPTTQATQQPATQPTTLPTVQPTRVSTPTQQLLIANNMAVLGGTISAFDNIIGASNCCTRNGWDDGNNWVGVYTAEDGNQWYQAVGEQSNEHVVGIYLSPYNTTFNGGTPVWSSTQAKKVCNAYLPSDTKFIKTVNGRDEYYSLLLAHTLPSSDFTDSNNHTNTPGIFYGIFHLIDGFSTNVDYCAFGTDYSLQREDVTIL